MNISNMILLFVFATTGCHGGPAGKHSNEAVTLPVTVAAPAVPAEMVSIRFEQVARYHDLSLVLLDVNDSRCPKGVNCFQAGEVRVTLEVSGELPDKSASVKVQLTSPVRGEPIIATEYGYRLELLSVEPYPQDGVVIERSNYIAEIQISDADS